MLIMQSACMSINKNYAVGEEGLLASRDLMPFEFSLYETCHFDANIIFSCTDNILKSILHL